MKRIIIGSVTVLVLIVLGWYFYRNKSATITPEAATQALDTLGSSTDVLTQSVTQGILPSLSVNPLESKPDVNPAEKTNPFSSIKTNPFR